MPPGKAFALWGGAGAFHMRPTMPPQANALAGRPSGPRKPPQSSPPSPSASPSPPSPSSCPQIPSPEEKSGAFFRASSSFSASSPSAIRLWKKNHPAARAMHKKPIHSSHVSMPFLPAVTAGFHQCGGAGLLGAASRKGRGPKKLFPHPFQNGFRWCHRFLFCATDPP